MLPGGRPITAILVWLLVLAGKASLLVQYAARKAYDGLSD